MKGNLRMYHGSITTHRHTGRRTGVGLILIGTTIIALGGCATWEEPLPPVAYIGPTLSANDLLISQPLTTPTGYEIINTDRSQGRFPALLAIAQLEPAQPDDFAPAAKNPWWVGTIPDEDAVYWISLFNAVPQVRDVVILDRQSLPWPDVELKEITATAGRMDARLCLLWGPVKTEASHAGLIGVMVDTLLQQPVAVFRADASPADYHTPDADTICGDQRHEDVNYLVARKFEQQVKACIYDLIQLDDRPATTQPSPWSADNMNPFGTAPVMPVYIVPNDGTGGW